MKKSLHCRPGKEIKWDPVSKRKIIIIRIIIVLFCLALNMIMPARQLLLHKVKMLKKQIKSSIMIRSLSLWKGKMPDLEERARMWVLYLLHFTVC